MSEEQNKEEQLPGASSRLPETGNREHETIEPPQTIKDMEVHHHGHVHHQKKWKEYIFQFLMLFLAVFCGFLAEYKLEHVIEHQREKEFMVTMLEDLKSDTSLLKATIKNWEKVNSSIDSVADAIKLPLSNADMAKAYRHLNNALDRWSFSYNDRTIAQLKNSGGFRIVRNKIVSNKIIAYDQFNNDAIKKIYSEYNKFYENVVQLRNRALVQEIINYIFNEFGNIPPPLSINLQIDSLLNKNKLPYLNDTQSAVMFEFKNALLAYRKDFSNMMWGNQHLLEYADDLITLIKNEYHLE